MAVNKAIAKVRRNKPGAGSFDTQMEGEF